ncbi:hypothetical protein G6F46_015276 [Rhizopus delemar]|nr:hypothetical protein G6F46_015276 [Rhizopus delemar]
MDAAGNAPALPHHVTQPGQHEHQQQWQADPECDGGQRHDTPAQVGSGHRDERERGDERGQHQRNADSDAVGPVGAVVHHRSIGSVGRAPILQR